jgi:hypothetical protein
MSKAEVVFDTGSGWLAVSAKPCNTCGKPKYDPDNSTTSFIANSSTRTLTVINNN